MRRARVAGDCRVTARGRYSIISGALRCAKQGTQIYRGEDCVSATQKALSIGEVENPVAVAVEAGRFKEGRRPCDLCFRI